MMPLQDGHVAKSLQTVAAVLEALCADRGAGLAELDRIALVHPHCPQVAGAQFFVQRHDDPDRSADLRDRFCEAPFIKFETLMDGSVAPCCSIWTQKRLGQLDDQTADEIWNSASAQAMRGSILDGSYRYCHKQRCTLIMDDVLPSRAEPSRAATPSPIRRGVPTSTRTARSWRRARAGCSSRMT